jgi:hypothetical protein
MDGENDRKIRADSLLKPEFIQYRFPEIIAHYHKYSQLNQRLRTADNEMRRDQLPYEPRNYSISPQQDSQEHSCQVLYRVWHSNDPPLSAA